MKKKTTEKQGSQARIDRREARAWMVLQGIRPKDIQDSMSLRYHSQVVETLTGKRDDRRVLQWLLDHGCPSAHLRLPKSMGEGGK